jgi:hypothetical protein
MAVVSPHRSQHVCLLASLAVLAFGASSARAQDQKAGHPHTNKSHAAPTKHKTDHRTTPAPQGAVAPAKPAPAEIKRAQAENTESQEQMTTRGPTRLDFDDRLIQGQGNKVGAVYLYDRKNLPLRSMVHQPTNFRDQISGDSVAGAVIE